MRGSKYCSCTVKFESVDAFDGECTCDTFSAKIWVNSNPKDAPVLATAYLKLGKLSEPSHRSLYLTNNHLAFFLNAVIREKAHKS